MKDLCEGLLVLALMLALVFVNAHTAEIKEHIWPEPAPAIEQPVAPVSPAAAPSKPPYGTDALTGIKIIHDMDSAYLVPIIKDALRLLKAKDPDHYALVSRYVTTIEIRDKVPPNVQSGSVAWVDPAEQRTVFLCGPSFPAGTDRRFLASALVHEAVHCRQADEGRLGDHDVEAEAYLTQEVTARRLGVSASELAAFREDVLKFISTPDTQAGRD